MQLSKQHLAKSPLTSQAYPAWMANCGSSDCHLQPPSLVPPNCRSPPNHIIPNQNHLHTDTNYTLQKHLNRTLVTLIPQSICFAESILLIFYLSAFATYSLCLYEVILVWYEVVRWWSAVWWDRKGWGLQVAVAASTICPSGWVLGRLGKSEVTSRNYARCCLDLHKLTQLLALFCEVGSGFTELLGLRGNL